MLRRSRPPAGKRAPVRATEASNPGGSPRRRTPGAKAWEALCAALGRRVTGCGRFTTTALSTQLNRRRMTSGGGLCDSHHLSEVLAQELQSTAVDTAVDGSRMCRWIYYPLN